jgi:hypothetical protein
MMFVARAARCAVMTAPRTRFLFVVLLASLAVFPAAAQTPGTTRVKIKNPDPAKWSGSTGFFNNSTGEFVCRPLACPVPSKVTASISTSPTRSPDRQALAKLAGKIPDAISQANEKAVAMGRKLERISSGTSTIRGYPAIFEEARAVSEKGPLYVSRVTLFVKSALVSFTSYSGSLDVARRNRSLFTQAMEVEDTPIR